MGIPPKVELRTAVLDDLGAMTKLWNDEAVRQIPVEVLAEKLWADPDVSPPMRVVATAPDGRIVGFVAGVRRSTIANGAAIKMIAVARRYQRLGIGRTLLDNVFSVLADSGTESVLAGESPPNYLQPGVDAGTGAVRFFEEYGFECTGTVYNMTVDLISQDFPTADAETEVGHAGIHIRRALSSDLELVRALLDGHWPSWNEEVDTASRQQSSALHIAVDESDDPPRAVAFAAHSANNSPLGWFGPMGTMPDYRGRGLGAILLKRCLTDLANAGHTSATISWVGPVSFYEKAVGARVSRTFLRYEKRIVR